NLCFRTCFRLACCSRKDGSRRSMALNALSCCTASGRCRCGTTAHVDNASALPVVLLFLGFFLLGMPLSGAIPAPRSMWEPALGEQPDTLYVAVVWSLIYLLAGLTAARNVRLVTLIVKKQSAL